MATNPDTHPARNSSYHQNSSHRLELALIGESHIKKSSKKGDRYASRTVRLQLPGQPGDRALPAGEAIALAEGYSRQQQPQAAVQIAEQVTRQLPRFAAGWLLLFGTLNTLGDYPNLEHAGDTCLQQMPRFVPALVGKATALRMQQRLAEALDCIEAALKLEPGNARLHNHAGILYKELGEFAKALASFNRSIALEPRYTDAYWNRADIFPEVSGADIEAMLKLLQHPTLSVPNRASLHYAIARAYEYLGDNERQFAHIDAGAKTKRQTLHYDHDREVAETRRIIEVFDAELMRTAEKPAPNQTGTTPIFICGLPRSGTTLAEQILSSHPAVNAGEEMTALPQATADVLHRFSINSPFPEWCSGFDKNQWLAIGQRYRELTSPLHGKPWFTDKNLQNYKAIGLIHLALPEARIVFCRRNAMDIIWGCYRQLFGDGLAFTYSLDELAETYLAAQELLDHWKNLLGEQLHILDYESLVTDQEQTTRNLLDYIGLEWHDACLEFHRNRRAVRTTSASQVRSPISRRRIDQWRQFERQLQAVNTKLESVASTAHNQAS